MIVFSASEKDILRAVLNSTISVVNKTEPDIIRKSLFSGELGVGYFLAILEYNKIISNGNGVDIIQNVLSNQTTQRSNSICNGNAGIYWLLSKASGKLFEIDNDFLNFLQQECIDGLKSEIEKQHFDYLHGAFGILHALLSGFRMKENELSNVLDLILQASKNHAIFPSSYSPDDKKGINLHLAHGISAYIIVLVELFNKTKNKEIAILIERHCEILKNSFKRETFSCFPFTSESGEYNVRNAWCYGDLGISIALYKASQILNNDTYFEIAKYTWERTCLKTNKKEVRIYDSPLCHGIFGNLLMYSKIYQYLGKSDVIRNTISKYIEKIEWYHNRYGENFLQYHEIDGFQYHRTYLTGVSGIGLTCLELLNYDSFESSKLLLV